MEQWRSIDGYGGAYEVSDAGRVRSAGGAIVRPHEVNGYHRVSLNKDRKQRSYAVHRLVLVAFVGPSPAGMIGLHNNDNRLDNRLANVRWGTYAENIADAKRNGRWRRMDDDLVRAVRASAQTDAQLAKMHNLSEIAVFNARLGLTYRHVV